MAVSMFKKHKGIHIVLSLLINMLVLSCGNGAVWTALHDDEVTTEPFSLEVLSLTPADDQNSVPVDSNITVTFNGAVNPDTMSVNGGTGKCTGNFQVSRDNFQTCIGGAVSSSDNITFTFSPANDFETCTAYKVKITTAVTAAEGDSLDQEYITEKGFVSYGNPEWTESDRNPLFGGDRTTLNGVTNPCVLKVNGIYHIWYGSRESPVRKTRHTTSRYADFRDADFPAAVVTGLDYSEHAYKPSVIYREEGWGSINGSSACSGKEFLMYYAVNGNADNVRAACSSDGDSWTDAGKIMDKNYFNTCGGTFNVYNFMPIFENSSFLGYHDNGGGVTHVNSSTDGLNWTCTATDILTAGNLPWEDLNKQQRPSVVKYNSIYHIFYYSGHDEGNDGNTTPDNDAEGIGYATSTDGENFTKYSGNPIFSINDGVSWRSKEVENPWIMKDGPGWKLYFDGRDADDNQQIGVAEKCGDL